MKRQMKWQMGQLKTTITMRRAVMAAAGIAMVGGVILGAAEAFAASSATPGSSASAVSAASDNASAALDNASAASITASKKSGCKRSAHPIRCALAERGAHGQETVKDKAGAYVVREWQIGTVGAISGSTITVTDGSGATWTWTVQSSTKYRVDGASGSLGAIHVGDAIVILGRQNGSVNEATAVVEPKGRKK